MVRIANALDVTPMDLLAKPGIRERRVGRPPKKKQGSDVVKRARH
jgi:hypothetical protein